MCLSYAWQYKCGCIAPKPSSNLIYRCASWNSRRSCQPKQLFSYIDVDCVVSCQGGIGTDKPQRQEEDWFLQHGSYQGAPSEEDYFFHRVPAHLTEPIFIRRRRQGTVVQRLADIPEYQNVVASGASKEAGLSDGQELALDLDSDIAVDESKQGEHHVSKANFGGRFTRRKK
ncbi:hypothetical protein N431DRAFT_397757 [Stipitochalara longipes BDJ]|nr:hypothetical protein N431DRAFT_397757 [Stipitochalara longipes BDJ]